MFRLSILRPSFSSPALSSPAIPAIPCIRFMHLDTKQFYIIAGLGGDALKWGTSSCVLWHSQQRLPIVDNRRAKEKRVTLFFCLKTAYFLHFAHCLWFADLSVRAAVLREQALTELHLYAQYWISLLQLKSWIQVQQTKQNRWTL